MSRPWPPLVAGRDEYDEAVEELRRARAERDRYRELLDHFDRYASVPSDGAYNGSPFQAEVREALGMRQEPS